MNLSARTISIVLFLSLALNLFLGGMLTVGWITRRAFEPARGGPGPSEMLFHAGEALGGGQHPRLRSVIDPRKPALVGHRRAIRSARTEVVQALEAEPFDRQRLSRGLAALRRETASSQAILHESLVELAQGMNVEQRRRMATLAIAKERGPRRRPR